MPNSLSLAGAQPQKQPRFAPIFTSRFFSGIWTNRSPLRDATTSRIVEKFYGQAGDAIIAGTNIEITNKLTFARRPGTSVYDSNSYTDPDRYYEFRLFNSTTEQIDVMIDQANALYSLHGGVKTLVFTKSTGSGQTYMQSVGNELYFADGVDNKKWLQSLFIRSNSTLINTNVNPFFTTFLIDPNGNIQQLTGSYVTANAVNWGDGLLIITTDQTNLLTSGVVAVGDSITFPNTMTATQLEGLTLEVTGIAANELEFSYINLTTPTYSGAESHVVLENIGSGTPTTGSGTPTWSTVVPSPSNNFAGGVTLDGSALWTNRGLPVENWGIDISNGKQLAKPLPVSPSVSETIAGGSSSSSQTGPGSNITSNTLSGFGSSPVSENVTLNMTFNATSTFNFTVLAGGPDPANYAQILVSPDGGASYISLYTQTFQTPFGATSPYTIAVSNIPLSTVLSGVSNLNNIQVKIITESFGANAGDVANFTVTLGAITVATGNNALPWTANTAYSLGQVVIDSNNNLQTVTVAGISGLVQPNWNTILGGTTFDNSITWENTFIQAISAFNGGFEYSIALVNSLDATVSNATPLSVATGNFVGAQGVAIPAGAGLPPLSQIDPQADYVDIFRTVDGGSVPFLINGPGNFPYTIPLAQYIAEGYVDNTLDTQLNNQISGAIAGENTPPGIGAINLTYHLSRIWYSIGNVVYWTTGPDTPVGNGINGTSPLNFAAMPSLVKRIVPTTSGALIFTVSDVYIIQGNGTTNNPIQGALPLLPGIGLLSYNALDQNGPTIGLFTTDNQFIILDPSSGTTYAGFPIGDQLRQNNGSPGTSWNPANVYVAWHVQGEDQAWYVCDGTNGWYRLMSTPAPESGYTWSPFATITGGAGAVQSVEVTPGVHRLLIGPTGTGELLQRDLTVFTDNGTTYPANATIGSLVLAQPGQVAEVAHIVCESAKVGAPVELGFLTDEAFPYYTGPIDILKEWTSDPPNLSPSQSLYSQRFYLANIDDDDAAVMRHCQIQIIFSPYDTVQNEMLTLTVFGAYSQEV
jgi:hypothetical protein